MAGDCNINGFLHIHTVNSLVVVLFLKWCEQFSIFTSIHKKDIRIQKKLLILKYFQRNFMNESNFKTSLFN